MYAYPHRAFSQDDVLNRSRALVLVRFSLVIATLATLIVLTGCGPSPVITQAQLDRTVIRPNELGLDPEARFGFTLARRADVWATLIGPDGKEYTLRDRVTRAPDAYEIAFDGTIETSPGNRRVLPDGDYMIRLFAEDELGTRAEKTSVVSVRDADTEPVVINDLGVSHALFTPNGDSDADEVRIYYQVTKASEVTVYVVGEDGSHNIIDPPTERNASMLEHIWDGTTGGRVMGGKLLPNGLYTIHVEARDASGNTSLETVQVQLDNGGTPRLEITNVRFWPPAVPLGGTLNVRITVKNNGDTMIKTQGPPSGTAYSDRETFATFRNPARPDEPAFFERPGVWRVGVTWDNAPQEFPIRWGLFPEDTRVLAPGEERKERVLAPGEEAVVEGQIRIETTMGATGNRQRRFYAGIIQEGVGYPGGRVAPTVITLSY
jgi:hypothetical protein